MHPLSQDDLHIIEDAFGIPRDGPWNKLAVTFVGLSFPLHAGWKLRLLRHGAAVDAPVAQGIDPHAWRWLHGDIDDNDEGTGKLKHLSKSVDPHQYVMMRIDWLEGVVTDLRAQADRMKQELRELRGMISKDEW